MLKIGCAGIGGFGNQISKLSAKEHIETLALNTSPEDLNDLVDICQTALIGDKNGCGKDRALSKSLIKANHEQIIKDFKDLFNECDVVFIVASTDGGTGSGAIALLVALLQKFMPNIIFVPVVVTPLDTESIRAQNNTKECIKELLTLNTPFIIKDNNRTQFKSLLDIYSSINNDIIEDFKIIRGDYCVSSSYGNMDDRDRLKLLATPGMLSINKISGIKLNDLDNDSLDDYIIKSIKESYNADIERDKVITRMGIINMLPEDIIPKMDKSYEKVKQHVGEPLEVFEHLTVDNDIDGSIITILSGLTYPMTKIDYINQLIKSKEEALTKSKKDDSKLFESFGFLDNDNSLLNKNVDDKNNNVNVDDIMNMF